MTTKEENSDADAIFKFSTSGSNQFSTIQNYKVKPLTSSKKLIALKSPCFVLMRRFQPNEGNDLTSAPHEGQTTNEISPSNQSTGEGFEVERGHSGQNSIPFSYNNRKRSGDDLVFGTTKLNPSLMRSKIIYNKMKQKAIHFWSMQSNERRIASAVLFLSILSFVLLLCLKILREEPLWKAQLSCGANWGEKEVWAVDYKRNHGSSGFFGGASKEMSYGGYRDKAGTGFDSGQISKDDDVSFRYGTFVNSYSHERLKNDKQPWVTALPVDKPAFPSAHVDDLLLLPVRPRAKTIAIVTLGLKPFNKFGGIGTMFYNYVQFYANEGFVVHVYYAGTVANKEEAKAEIKEYLHHSKIHIHLIDDPDVDSLETLKYPKVYGTSEMERSNQIYMMLKQESTKYFFDAFLFHDYRGIASATIQAKRGGLAFKDTTIIVTCHTSSYNSAFFNARFTLQEDAVLNELEDYTRNYADVVVYVSYALRNQMEKLSIYEGLETPAKILVLPNFVYGDIFDEFQSNNFDFMPAPRKFAYFGRLDNLKGIDVFIESIKVLVAKLRNDPNSPSLSEVAIIGDYPGNKGKQATGILVNNFISEMAQCGIVVKQFNNLMTVEATKKMLEEEYVAVLPSLYETYSMALLETLSFGIPVIHGDAGGQSEVSKNNLNIFHNSDPQELAKVMLRVMREGLVQDVPAIPHLDVLENYVRVVSVDSAKLEGSRDASVKAVRDVSLSVGEEGGGVGDEGNITPSKEGFCEDVTVAIVTFLDRLEGTRDLLERLVQQTCNGFEVILFVNSICNEEECGLEFGETPLSHFKDSLRVLLPPQGTKISVGDARNIMIREVKTEYVVLFDDDDIPRGDFVEVMRRAAIMQGADLVTCHAGFVEERPSAEEVAAGTVTLDHVSLAGGNTGPAANFHVHHTGKANVLLRTLTAQKLGPCLPELSISTSPFVDWGMYTNFILHKAVIAVVPESMYYYKMHSTGSIFYGSTDFTKYLGAKKIVNEYCRYYNLDTMGCEVLWMAKQLSLKYT